MRNKRYGDIIAVDFDGTLCVEDYPGIGKPNLPLINYLINMRKAGNEVILYTMREGAKLDEATKWCKAHGLTFDAINDNLPRMRGFFGNNPRKVFANIYIDDHNASPDLWGLPYKENV